MLLHTDIYMMYVIRGQMQREVSTKDDWKEKLGVEIKKKIIELPILIGACKPKNTTLAVTEQRDDGPLLNKIMSH